LRLIVSLAIAPRLTAARLTIHHYWIDVFAEIPQAFQAKVAEVFRVRPLVHP
jgi:hypothetical protein